MGEIFRKGRYYKEAKHYKKLKLLQSKPPPLLNGLPKFKLFNHYSAMPWVDPLIVNKLIVNKHKSALITKITFSFTH